MSGAPRKQSITTTTTTCGAGGTITTSTVHSSSPDAVGALEAERDQLRKQLAWANEELRVRMVMLRRLLCDSRPIEDSLLEGMTEYADNSGGSPQGVEAKWKRRHWTVDASGELVPVWSFEMGNWNDESSYTLVPALVKAPHNNPFLKPGRLDGRRRK